MSDRKKKQQQMETKISWTAKKETRGVSNVNEILMVYLSGGEYGMRLYIFFHNTKQEKSKIENIALVACRHSYTRPLHPTPFQKPNDLWEFFLVHCFCYFIFVLRENRVNAFRIFIRVLYVSVAYIRYAVASIIYCLRGYTLLHEI